MKQKDKAQQIKVSKAKTHPFLVIGSMGLAITAVLNLFNTFILNAGGETWWSAWFPLYAVWFTFLIIGLGLTQKGKTDSVEG